MPVTALVVLSVLPKVYNAYKAISATIKEWKQADKDLIMLSIRFDVEYSKASYLLDQLAIVPNHPDTTISVRERELEIRQNCINMMETVMEKSGLQMESLLEQREGLKVTEKAAWILSSRKTLTTAVVELESWTELATRVCDIKVNYLYQSHPHIGNVLPPPSLPVEALAEMALARANAIASPTLTDTVWIDPSLLTFDEADESNGRSKDAVSWSNLLTRLRIQKSSKLKFQFRRFAVLNLSSSPEQIMVEFRPYNEELRHFRPGEYDHTRNQALELGLMLHTATAFNPDSNLPFVPFRYVSELRDTNPPCFLLIYRGDNLETLFSVIMAHARDSQPSPSKAFRLRLAVALARAVFSLHRTGYVHGGLTTDNIFLRPDRDADSVAPLIAGCSAKRRSYEPA